MIIINFKKIISIISIMSVFVLVFYNTKDFFIGPPLYVETAKDGATVTDSFLPISGSAKHASSIEINGRIVAIDKNGSFSDGVVLSPGYNIVEVTQKDKFGKDKNKILHLVAQPSDTVAANMEIHYQ